MAQYGEVLVDGGISRSFNVTSTCENKEWRNTFTGPTSLFGSKAVRFALVVLALTESLVRAKSRYSSPIPEISDSIEPLSVTLLRG